MYGTLPDPIEGQKDWWIIYKSRGGNGLVAKGLSEPSDGLEKVFLLCVELGDAAKIRSTGELREIYIKK